MTSFFTTIDTLVQLSPESKAAFSKKLRRLELPKGHVLVRENTVCNEVFFVESGLSRTYYYKDGKDVTDWISTEGSFACSIVSFITRQPDRRGIELLEDSVLQAITWHELELLYTQFHDMEKLGRMLVNAGLVQLQKRFDDLHFSTALERYKNILENQPTLIERVPLGILASYLGMSQETLSRMRGKL